MVAWEFQSCDDYISYNRAAGAEENRQLKQLVADLNLDKQMLQDVLKKSFEAGSKKEIGQNV